MDIGITYLSTECKVNYHLLIHSNSQIHPQLFFWLVLIWMRFLTIVDYPIHIFFISLSTFIQLWINRDKVKVSLALSWLLIPMEVIYSTSFHFLNLEKAISPQDFWFVNRVLWIVLMNEYWLLELDGTRILAERGDLDGFFKPAFSARSVCY